MDPARTSVLSETCMAYFLVLVFRDRRGICKSLQPRLFGASGLRLLGLYGDEGFRSEAGLWLDRVSYSTALGLAIRIVVHPDLNFPSPTP